VAAVFGTRGTVISPPMAMTCHLGSTYGDDSGFRRHPRRRFPNVVGKKNHLPTIRRLRRTTAPTPSLRTNLCERHLRCCTEDAAKVAAEDAAKDAVEDAAKDAAEAFKAKVQRPRTRGFVPRPGGAGWLDCGQAEPSPSPRSP